MGPQPSTFSTFSLILKFLGHECATSYWKERNMSTGLNTEPASLSGANAQWAGKQNFTSKVKLIF
jgi:hypothetical protein